jgi:hypothetical protein
MSRARPFRDAFEVRHQSVDDRNSADDHCEKAGPRKSREPSRRKR